ncbi:hypothetical protein PYCC9005_002976 [Savitreella phatthalungensis]
MSALQRTDVGRVDGDAVVLHEDKQYYPSAREVYGPDVETLVQEEDTQALSEPIVAPRVERKFAIEEQDLPDTLYDRTFLLQTAEHPEFLRNVAVVGHLHHGKTSLLDMLVTQSHPGINQPRRDRLRYTDNHVLERARGISIRAAPITLMLPSSSGKSLVTTFIDTPGHCNFIDEVACGLAAADGMLLCVDAAEGFVPETAEIVRLAVAQQLDIALCITKLDRLILELKFPPQDAYIKLRHLIEEVNVAIASVDPSPSLRVSPERGNVIFTAATLGWSFTLDSFARFYAEQYRGIMVEDFALRLWGDFFYDEQTRRFNRSSEAVLGGKRSFVHFILEPIYKLVTHTLATEKPELEKTLASLGIKLKPAAYKLDARPLLELVSQEFFGEAKSMVDVIFRTIKPPHRSSPAKLEHLYQGLPMQDGLLCHAIKLLPATDALSFSCLVRVYSGTLRRGQRVNVLDETSDNVHIAEISGVFLPGGRYKAEVEQVGPGSIVLVDGIDDCMTKTATLTSSQDVPRFAPLAHLTSSVVRLAVEPYNPPELPKMLAGLQMINKAYPLASIRVEESGEHTIFGTGELYLDCIMHDLRKLYAGVEVKVSDPSVSFCETCIETSVIKCRAGSPNKKNTLTVVATQLDDAIAKEIQAGQLETNSYSSFQRHGWDVLAARSIWAFGPESHSPNLLRDDTLDDETDKGLLSQTRESVVQGFRWATREGPLCDEPVRNTQINVLDAVLANESIFRGAGQIVPAMRRVCYSGMLTATPRLMEPVYLVACMAPAESVSVVYAVLERRRGHVTQEVAIAGTPFYRVVGLVPVIDSFGFETDLRAQTRGKAFCQLAFDSWQIVPGDPLDKSAKPRALQQATAQQMARDFVLKTRRRKGLNTEISLSKYLDEDAVQLLRENDLVDPSLL